MDSSRPWLLIPMETKVRELHSKLLLGAFAAESGYDVIIGEQLELKRQLKFLPRGIVLEKGVTQHQVSDMVRSRDLGNRVVAWCEEGLVYRNHDAYLRTRVSLEAMGLLDRFFAWGSVQAQAVLEKATDAAEKLVLAGNPRFDLLRPELRGLFKKEAEELKETYGPYILVATNFGRVNHFRGPEFVSRLLEERGAHASKEISEFTNEWTNFLGKVYSAFLRMVPELARAFPELTIIIRPHPSENRESWEQKLLGFANVKIIHEGPIIPWLLGSDMLVHNSCTTGVEGYLLDVPVIAYRPVTSEDFDSVLPNTVSHQAFTIDELISLIGAVRTEGGLIPGFTAEEASRRRAIARRYIEGIDGPFASDRIVAALRQVPVSARWIKSSPIKRVAMAGTNLVSSVRNVAASAAGRVVVGTAYLRHKFSGLELAEVDQLLVELSEISERFRGIRVEAIPGLNDGFRITSA